MKIKFRFHRGSLSDSLKTQREYTSLQSLIIDLCSKMIFDKKINPKSIKIKPYCEDERCNQYTFIVSCDLGVLGFIVEDLE